MFKFKWIKDSWKQRITLVYDGYNIAHVRQALPCWDSPGFWYCISIWDRPWLKRDQDARESLEEIKALVEQTIRDNKLIEEIFIIGPILES